MDSYSSLPHSRQTYSLDRNLSPPAIPYSSSLASSTYSSYPPSPAPETLSSLDLLYLPAPAFDPFSSDIHSPITYRPSSRFSLSAFLLLLLSIISLLFSKIKGNFGVHIMVLYLLSSMYDYSIFLLSFLLYFSFGWIFFIKKLFVSSSSWNSYGRRPSGTLSETATTSSRFRLASHLRHQSLQKHIVHVIFAVTLALSCTLFELIIFEILGILDPGYASFIVSLQC